MPAFPNQDVSGRVYAVTRALHGMFSFGSEILKVEGQRLPTVQRWSMVGERIWLVQFSIVLDLTGVGGIHNPRMLVLALDVFD